MCICIYIIYSWNTFKNNRDQNTKIIYYKRFIIKIALKQERSNEMIII